MLIHEYLEMDVYGLPLVINSVCVCPYNKNIFCCIFCDIFSTLPEVEALTWILFFVSFIHTLIRIKRMPTHNTHNLRSSLMVVLT